MGQEVILFLDTCSVIYWLEVANPFYARFLHQLATHRKKNPEVRFAVSRLTLLECRVKPLRDNNQPLLELYNRFFSAGDLEIVEMSPRVVEIATELRARVGLATPDALLAASALTLPKPTIFLTNDRIFKKVTGLTVEVL